MKIKDDIAFIFKTILLVIKKAIKEYRDLKNNEYAAVAGLMTYILTKHKDVIFESTSISEMKKDVLHVIYMKGDDEIEKDFNDILNRYEITFSKAVDFLIGNYRYELFYIKPHLMLKHVFEQIIARVNSMDKKCDIDGQCKLCGCKTKHLQMCNRACDKPCYPKMLSKRNWQLIKSGRQIIDGESVWEYTKKTNKFKKVI